MMERKTDDARARLQRKIECLRKMYALGDPITPVFFRNPISVSVIRSGINHHAAQGLERSTIAEAPPRPSSYSVLEVGIGEVTEALRGAGTDHLVFLASRTRKRKNEDASSMLEARAQRPSVIHAAPSLKDECEVVDETAEPSREGEMIDEFAEEVSNANDQASQLSESDRSHQEEIPAGKQSIPINQPPDFSGSRNTIENRKFLACDVRETKFSCAIDHTRHQRIHTGEKPFPCDVCKKEFNDASNLRRHQRIHTGEKPFVCDVCEKKFGQASDLGRHQRIHTGEKPFVCDVCEKKFSQASDLGRHRRVHTGEKPFPCDVCGKSFSQSDNLKIHRRIHTGEKPFPCDVCGKRFIHSGDVRRHRRTHRDKKPISCEVSQTPANVSLS